MNQIPRIGALLLFMTQLLLGLSAFAQTEIDVAYGVRIGAPLSIAECPKTGPLGAIVYQAAKVPCVKTINPTAASSDFSKGGWIVFPFDQKPAQSSGDIVGLSMLDGRVGVLVVSTGGLAVQDRVFDDLVAKYGKPSSAGTVPLQNAMSAKYESIVAKWDLDPIEVQFIGASGKLNQGQLLIGTKAGIQDRQMRIDRVLKSGRTPL